MAEPEEQAEAASAEAQTQTTDTFEELLKKEFKPKSDRAHQAVENAVRTLAAQALEQADLISDKELDAIKKIQSIIALLDKRLSDQITLIMHQEDFQTLERS